MDGSADDSAPREFLRVRFLTNHDFGVDGERVADWFAACLDRYIIALLPADRKATVWWIKSPESRGGKELPYSRIEEVLSAIRTGQFFDLGFSSRKPPNTEHLDFTVQRRTLEVDLGAPNEIDISTNSFVINTRERLDALTACMRDAALLAGTGNGALRIGRDPSQISLDVSKAAYSAHSYVDDADRWLQGTFWANTLGPEHLAHLGGIEQVIADNPTCVHIPLGDPPTQLYIQATKDITTCTIEDLLRLNEALLPVIPPSLRIPSIGVRAIITAQLEAAQRIFRSP